MMPVCRKLLPEISGLFFGYDLWFIDSLWRPKNRNLAGVDVACYFYACSRDIVDVSHSLTIGMLFKT